jgi:hypothetical protein
MAERHNTRLGVVDPVDRRLNVLFWLMQHYQEVGDTGMAAEVKAAYYSLRDAAPDVVALVRMGELDEATLLKRLVNGQTWLTQEHEKWATDNPDTASDTGFQKALDGWVAMETHLREKHGYRQCIHGEGQRCPEDAPVRCDACVKAQEGHESPGSRVKKSDKPSPPRMGRRKVESWEAEMLRLARTGMGVHKIAKALQSQGVEISGPTVSARLKEMQGQLASIS